ncbi:hypothetical protein K491DRAFT_699289 [Lophiostoma macrostomum CBS 122681]|uniref:Uncharacterized protein n=1 Tax=Lophiostoma macrostomum CBS 122681 TaxID=1314788 RepID=A0A6A6SNM1_9PLEO|nr:hypothetical protein K491DRAFT_699289 [Lophiostoma macrostomum CBS 122681]
MHTIQRSPRSPSLTPMDLIIRSSRLPYPSRISPCSAPEHNPPPTKRPLNILLACF